MAGKMPTRPTEPVYESAEYPNYLDSSGQRKSVKYLTCYYWQHGGCKKTEQECLYSHRDTGIYADRPRPVRPGGPVLAGRNAALALNDRNRGHAPDISQFTSTAADPLTTSFPTANLLPTLAHIPSVSPTYTLPLHGIGWSLTPSTAREQHLTSSNEFDCSGTSQRRNLNSGSRIVPAQAIRPKTANESFPPFSSSSQNSELRSSPPFLNHSPFIGPAIPVLNREPPRSTPARRLTVGANRPRATMSPMRSAEQEREKAFAEIQRIVETASLLEETIQKVATQLQQIDQELEGLYAKGIIEREAFEGLRNTVVHTYNELKEGHEMCETHLAGWSAHDEVFPHRQ